MTKITADEQAENLRKFFLASANSVTRERIFFDRLSFDLKIAAARADYHLHIYEPDVDRDGFDIVVEDQEEGLGWFQLKAVLKSAATENWYTSAHFLRPTHEMGDAFQVEPMSCGRGGGVIIIEIDDTTDRGDVAYSYTDYRILTALAERYLIEKTPAPKSRGRPKNLRADAAAQVLKEVHAEPRSKSVRIPRAAFIEMKSPDALLAVMAMWNVQDYAAFGIQNAYGRVQIGSDGMGVVDEHSLPHLGSIRHHMKNLVEILSSREDLKPLAFISPGTGQVSR